VKPVERVGSWFAETREPAVAFYSLA
jgi:hypothetical protein